MQSALQMRFHFFHSTCFLIIAINQNHSLFYFHSLLFVVLPDEKRSSLAFCYFIFVMRDKVMLIDDPRFRFFKIRQRPSGNFKQGCFYHPAHGI